MVNQQVLSGKWNEMKRKVKQKWGKLSDDDLRSFNGNVDQLVGRIQQKTGESRDAIERFLGEIAEEDSHVVADVRDRIEEVAGAAAEAASDSYDTLRHSYTEAERVVQARPGQSIAIAFGLGLLSGLGVALLLRDRTQESRLLGSRASAEHFGRQMRDALAGMVPESLAKKHHG